jgi:membrane protein implicated in regulation of membrane protease activity
MRWDDSLEMVDVGIGIVGFFAFAFLIVTIVTELMGADALGWALTLLALVLALVLLWQARRRIVAARRPADEDKQASGLPGKIS